MKSTLLRDSQQKNSDIFVPGIYENINAEDFLVLFTKKEVKNTVSGVVINVPESLKDRWQICDTISHYDWNEFKTFYRKFDGQVVLQN